MTWTPLKDLVPLALQQLENSSRARTPARPIELPPYDGLKLGPSSTRMISMTDRLLFKRVRWFLSLSATRTRTLRTNFLWNAAGIGVFSLAQWGILIAFAKFGTPALVGQLVYGLALTTPIFVIASLQLRDIQATDTENRHKLSEYLGLRVLTTGAAIVATLVVAAMVWAGEVQMPLIILLWGLSKTFDAGSDVLYGLFQQAERMDYVGFSCMLRGLLAVASVVTLLRAGHSAPIALAGLALSWGLVFILFDIPIARLLVRHRNLSALLSDTISESLRPVLKRRQLAPLCFEAAPLGGVAFLYAVQLQLPRYVIAGLLHTRELGLFSAAAYLTLIGTALVSALGAPASVRLAQYFLAGTRSAFRQLMTKLLLFASALGAASILISACAGPQLLARLYTNEYSQMAGVLTVLCAGSAVSYIASFFSYGMTAMRRYRIQVPIFLGVVLITLLSCYWLTENYGMMGTAVGVLVGNLARLLMSGAVVLRTDWSDRSFIRTEVSVTTA